MQVSLKNGNYMIQGTATKDATLKIIGDKQTHITEFSLAVGKKEDGSTIYANCKAFGLLADCAKEIKKGHSVLCVGTTETREWNGKTYTDFKCDWLVDACNMAQLMTASELDKPANNAPTFEPIDDSEDPDDSLPF